MKSVRNEWVNTKTAEEKLAWADKWADLLMETWNNPIWTAGRANALLEVEAQMSAINAGEYIENPILPSLLQYANALKLIRSNLRVLHGEVTDTTKTPEELADMIIERIYGSLMDFMEYDPETHTLKFELVMVE